MSGRFVIMRFVLKGERRRDVEWKKKENAQRKTE